MNRGQSHRLTNAPPAEIDAAIREFADKLAAHGVSGFFLAFEYRIKGITFHTSCLHQTNPFEPRNTIHIAALETVQMMDTLYMTAETNGLLQTTRYTPPTLKP